MYSPPGGKDRRYTSSLPGGGAEVQRGSMLCPRSHSLEIIGQGLSVLSRHTWTLTDSGHQLSAIESPITASLSGPTS